MNNSKKHRIGILVKNLGQKNFNGELIRNILNSKNLVLDTIIINEEKNIKNKILLIIKKYSLSRIIEKFIFKILTFVEKCIFLISNKKISFAQVNLNNLNIPRVYISPNIDPIKNIYTYSDSDVKKIKDKNLDIILRLESGIIKGAILTATKKGIVSFHHADNELYRGLPPGFWEVYNKNPTTGFIIQKLNEQLDNGDIIFKGYTITKPYFFLNQQFIYKQSIKYLEKALENYLKNDNFRFETKKLQTKIYKEPNLKELFKYFFKTYSLILKKIFLSMRGFKEVWNIHYKNESFNKENLKEYKILKNFKNRFFADPFVINFENKNFIFAEDFDLKNKIGHISCIEIGNKSEKFLGKVIKENFHLSFPFIFKFNNNFYMCPETKEKKEIRIYKCKNFPNQWEFCKTLIDNIYAVDTVLFEKEKYWWLLTNTDKNNLEFSSELSIFYSSEGPITNNWQPHKLNPVVVDANKARNAGLFFDGKNYFRLNQKIGFNNYGIGFDINRINEISIESYDEKVESNINANFIKEGIGTHHMTTNNNFSAIDIKKFINRF